MNERSRRIKPSDLKIIFEVQRESISAWVKRLKREFNPAAIGTVYVSERSDGTLVVIDGQHRVLALRELGRDQPIWCHVYTGLTQADEAALFLLFNDRRLVKATDKFRIGVTAGHPDCVAVNEMLHERGLAMEGDRAANGCARVACAKQLLDEYNRSPRARTGPQSLACALDTILAAWGTGGSSFDAVVVSGISQVFHANGWVESRALAGVLAKFPSHAAGLIGRAKGRHEFERSSLSKCAAAVVIDEYNRRRRGPNNRLDYP